MNFGAGTSAGASSPDTAFWGAVFALTLCVATLIAPSSWLRPSWPLENQPQRAPTTSPCPPYVGVASFIVTMPARISAAAASRIGVAGSRSTIVPKANAPIAPIPTQTP